MFIRTSQRRLGRCPLGRTRSKTTMQTTTALSVMRRDAAMAQLTKMSKRLGKQNPVDHSTSANECVAQFKKFIMNIQLLDKIETDDSGLVMKLHRRRVDKDYTESHGSDFLALNIHLGSLAEHIMCLFVITNNSVHTTISLNHL
jgi:hypothetical protein